MITSEMLSQSSALSSLTDEQKSAIIELSTNDEKQVLANAGKSFSEGISAVMLEKSGTKRAKNESDADYIGRVVAGYVDNVKTLTATNTDLNDKLTKAANLPEELEKKYKQQISDVNKLNENLTLALASKEKEYADSLLEKDNAMKSIHLDYAFKEALNGVKFKSAFTPELQAMLLASAKNEVLSKATPDFVDNNGVKGLVFRGEDGNIMLNAANGLKPYTLSDLLMKTSLKDAIDTDIKQAGGGTKPKPSGASGGSFVITASTQVEADKEISAYLLSIGKTKDSVDYQKEFAKIRKENGVDKLQLR